jgi:predicted DNA-binding transcriptional regulator AlpA
MKHPTTSILLEKMMQNLVGKPILRMHEVKQLTTLSEPHIFALQAKGVFPRSFKLVPGGRASGIWTHEVLEYITNQANQEQ